MARNSYIEVQNLREMNAAIRKAGGPEAVKALRRANIRVVRPVVVEAKVLVPKRSGKLAASIGGGATARYAYVKAGTAKRVPYAGPINYGWPGPSMSRALAKSRSPFWANVGRKGVRGIAADHFLNRAVEHELPTVLHTYETEMRRACDVIDPS
jgi:hypothetical protein